MTDCPYHDMPPDQVITTTYAGHDFHHTAGELCRDHHQLMDAFDPEVQRQRAELRRVESADIRARRDRALATVGLTQAELRARVVDCSRGEPTLDERDAWHEVDVCNFLLDED